MHYTGCPNLLIATDHKPLFGVFQKSLADIQNPRLLSMAEKALWIKFKVVYVEGRLNNGPDYMSRQSGDSTRRHPVTAVTGGQCPGSKHAGGPHTFGGAQGVIVDRMKEATDPELVQLDPAQGGPAGWLAHTPRRAGRVQQGCDA